MLTGYASHTSQCSANRNCNDRILGGGARSAWDSSTQTDTLLILLVITIIVPGCVLLAIWQLRKVDVGTRVLLPAVGGLVWICC